MRKLRVFLCHAALIASVTVIVPAGLVQTANAQVSIGIDIGGPPPVCPYGYYDYAPYSCAPVGFYGPGYFYNGVFLGVGPWYQWGYRHGWGRHRFIGPRGGRYFGDGRGHYRGGRGYRSREGYRGHSGYHGHERRGEYRGGGPRGAARSHDGPHRGSHGGGYSGGHRGGSHGGDRR